MIRFSIHSLTFTIAALLLIHLSPAIQRNTLGNVKTSYEFPKQVSLHEPIILIFKVINNGAHLAKLDLGADRKGAFSFSLSQSGREELRLPQYSPEGIAQLGIVNIAPGESYSEELVLNEWYSFKAEGTYRITVHLSAPIIDSLTGASTRDAGDTSDITIGPRDPAVLETRCKSLMSIIENSSQNEANAAALQLSFINDPAAVPYLERALKSNKQINQFAISGLERIGDENSVAVLISNLTNRSLYTDSMARLALTQILQRTPDTSLHDKIQRALKAVPASPAR